jgi:hypothetical protein
MKRCNTARPSAASVCATMTGLLSTVLLALAGASDTAFAGVEQSDRCAAPPPGAKYLPATCTHGLIQYFRQYPVVRLATPSQRTRARLLRDRLIAAAKRPHGCRSRRL